jgi:hypothetical protein
MHATDLVGINGITRVLLVYTCQQGVYPRRHVLPLRLPSTTLSTTNPTRADSGSNLGHRCERSATNRLSHGIVWHLVMGTVGYFAGGRQPGHEADHVALISKCMKLISPNPHMTSGRSKHRDNFITQLVALVV